MNWALTEDHGSTSWWSKILTWVWQDGDQSAKRKHIFLLLLVPNTLVILKTSFMSLSCLMASVTTGLSSYSLPQEPQCGSTAQHCAPAPVDHVPRKPGLPRRLNCLLAVTRPHCPLLVTKASCSTPKSTSLCRPFQTTDGSGHMSRPQ